MISPSLQLTGPFDVTNHVTSAFKLYGLREPHSFFLFFFPHLYKVDPLGDREKMKNFKAKLIELGFGKRRMKGRLNNHV